MRVSRTAKIALAQVAAPGDNTAVRVFGPYPPSSGRQRWRLVVYSEADKARKSVTAPTLAAAEALKASLLAECERAAAITAKVTLVSEAVSRFMEYKRPLIAAHSITETEKRLLSFFPADMELAKITTAKAHELYEALTRQTTKRGTAMAAATHQHRLRLVKELFTWLVTHGLFDANPFATVKPLGRSKKGKPQLRESEAAALDKRLFADAKAGYEGALALLVQLYGAFRSSEVLGLLVGDCELLPSGRWRLHVRYGKTPNATRSVDLHDCLSRLLAKKLKGRAATDRVFASDLARVPAPDYMYKRLRRYCRQLGIQSYCPHSLRGYHASQAVQAGVTSEVVARTLGHGNFSVTARHYATPTAILNAKAKQVADKLRSGGKGPALPELTAADIEALKQYLASIGAGS